MNKLRSQQIRRWRQILRILAPFLLLLFCLGALQLIPLMTTGPDSTPIAAGLTPIPTVTMLPRKIAPVVTAVSTAVLATPAMVPETLSSPSPAATATPSIPPDTQIELLGPPAESVLNVTETASFYWLWPIPLTEDQAFAVYLFVEGQPFLLDEINEPNVGQAYRLHFPLKDLVQSPDTVEWQVVLITAASGTILKESELRSLNLSFTAQ